MDGVIYKITNKIDGKIYVGQTIQSAQARFYKHAKSNSLLGRDIQKYGYNNFVIEIVEECEDRDTLNEREKFWIEKLNCKVPNGYNIAKGGKSGRGEAAARNRIWLQEIQKRYKGVYKITDGKDIPEVLSEVFGI